MSSIGAKQYRLGTLVYTRASLVTLFGWLLWGDFIYTLMETVIPALLPLLLKENGATNSQIGFIGASIGMTANAVLNPIISFKSDRYRSRFGRRRPFILWTTPFVVLFLCVIPFAPDLIGWLREWAAAAAVMDRSPVPILIVLFALLVAGFQVFNMFVSSVYYYLIPDVVPEEFLGRFYGLFRVFGTAAALVFNLFLFGRADRLMHEIFVGIALLYGVVITLMCWRVKEGEYPPPQAEAHSHWWSSVRNYAQECFGTRYFWWVFITYACLTWSNAANPFILFFFRDEMGFSLASYGKLNAAGNILVILLSYPMGILLDRLGGHKSLILSQSLSAIVCLVAFGAAGFSPWSAAGFRLAATVAISMAGLSIMRWMMDVYPRERYGQFGSAGALFASLGGIVLAPLCGGFFDKVHSYNYFWLWIALFSALGAVSAMVVSRHPDRRRQVALPVDVPTGID